MSRMRKKDESSLYYEKELIRKVRLRALSDQTYYPMQFEVIEQSVVDWDTDDKSTMMVQISAIPINYDLAVKDNGKYEYIKGARSMVQKCLLVIM
jgi:hypothetical protein